MLLSTPLGVLVDSPAPPVIVQAFTESLCIDCKNFFLETLVPVYNQLGPKVIDLRITPFGNAEVDMVNKAVTCQHGPAECDANVWQQCAVRQANAPTYIKFFECLEKTLPMGSRDDPFEESIFYKCSKEAKMEFEGLKRCHGNPVLSWLLQKESSEKTPDHQSVPFVLIDENIYDYATDNFLEMVCKQYTANGGSHPSCSSAYTLTQ